MSEADRTSHHFRRKLDVFSLPEIDPVEIDDAFKNMFAFAPYHGLPFKRPKVSDKVISNFNSEQYPYIKLTAVALNSLANGLVLGTDEIIDDFADKVEQDFLRQDAKNLSFELALTNSVVGLIRDFKRYYPNFKPALHSFFEKGGAADGFRIAVSQLRNFLVWTMEVDDRIDKKFPKKEFSRTELLAISEGRKITGELRCAAQGLANTMELKTKEAANRLTNSHVVSFYKGESVTMKDNFAGLLHQAVLT